MTPNRKQMSKPSTRQIKLPEAAERYLAWLIDYLDEVTVGDLFQQDRPDLDRPTRRMVMEGVRSLYQTWHKSIPRVVPTCERGMEGDLIGYILMTRSNHVLPNTQPSAVIGGLRVMSRTHVSDARCVIGQTQARSSQRKQRIEKELRAQGMSADRAHVEASAQAIGAQIDNRPFVTSTQTLAVDPSHQDTPSLSGLIVSPADDDEAGRVYDVWNELALAAWELSLDPTEVEAVRDAIGDALSSIRAEPTDTQPAPSIEGRICFMRTIADLYSKRSILPVEDWEVTVSLKASRYLQTHWLTVAIRKMCATLLTATPSEDAQQVWAAYHTLRSTVGFETAAKMYLDGGLDDRSLRECWALAWGDGEVSERRVMTPHPELAWLKRAVSPAQGSKPHTLAAVG